MGCFSYVRGSGDAPSGPCLLLCLSVGASREDHCHRPISCLRGRDRLGIRPLGRQRAPADGRRQRDALCGPRAGQTHKHTQLSKMSSLQFGVIVITVAEKWLRSEEKSHIFESVSEPFVCRAKSLCLNQSLLSLRIFKLAISK